MRAGAALRQPAAHCVNCSTKLHRSPLNSTGFGSLGGSTGERLTVRAGWCLQSGHARNRPPCAPGLFALPAMTGAAIYGDERASTERGARREAPRAPECERSRALEVAPATRSEELAPPTGGALDTLAQLGQRSSQRARSDAKPARSEILLKRARAKYFSTPLAINLAKLRSPLEKSYRNTVYCSATLSQEDGKIVGSYCGNRWCMVCNRIRTARAIHRYLPMDC